MKTCLITLATMISLSGARAQTVKHNYQCIADRLEAYNSDIYYALTPAEIDELLSARSPKVVEVAKFCDVPAYKGLTATFQEVGQSTTMLEVVSQYGGELTLKTTKTTRWSAPSKFTDIRAITLDLGDNNGEDTLIQVTEVDGNQMGKKTTRMVFNCKMQEKILDCSVGNFKLVVQ